MLFSEIPWRDLRVSCPQADVLLVRVCRGLDVERFVGVRERTEILGVKPGGAGIQLVEAFVDSAAADFCNDAAVAVHRHGREHDLFIKNGSREMIARLGTVWLRELGRVDAIEADPNQARLAAAGGRSGERDGDGVAVVHGDDVCEQIVGARGERDREEQEGNKGFQTAPSCRRCWGCTTNIFAGTFCRRCFGLVLANLPG